LLSSVFNAAALGKAAKVLAQQRPRASNPTMLRFFAHWGGIGLVPLAILDSSPLPTFGSLDILTAYLSARHSDLWLYYASMATLGAMIGSYLTYKLGQKTGLAWIEKKFGARRSHQVQYALERWGSGAIFVSTVSPPPCPTSMFLLAAGAFGYKLRKFFLTVFLGRAIRYGLLTLIAAHYGRRIVRYMRHPGQYLWLSLGVTLLIILGTATFLILRRPAPVPEERLPHAS
jgi:membrane protein YqaA with SNARE-associated domain